jgi:mRNA capping enzyme/mRNA capping enzyme, catalytic domain
MSSTEKTNMYNLEDGTDFGSSELNEFYKTLDVKTREELNKQSDIKRKITILESMKNPEIQMLYSGLSEKNKTALDNMGLRDKYMFLRNMLEKNKKEAPVKIYSPHSPEEPPPQENNGDAPQELFDAKEHNDEGIDNDEGVDNVDGNVDIEDDETRGKLLKPIYPKISSKQGSPQAAFEGLVSKFYSMNPFVHNATLTHELEVRFGTRGIKPLSRGDYDNVIRKLKSFGFTTSDSGGKYYLRINCEFLDSTTGRFKLSDIRTELSGLHNIQEYCKTNDIKSIYKSNPASFKFIHKKSAKIGNEFMRPVDFDDFNFRVSYQNEIEVKYGIKNYMMESWRKSKKEFRFINRVSFEHQDYPFIIDISIVKYANRGPDKYGRENRGPMIRVYTVGESNVFENQEIYEIEIEVNNSAIGPGTRFDSPKLVVESLRKVIKYILGGLQGTNYPISYPEQQQVLDSYMNLIWRDEYDPKKRITSQFFIGPNSITLQLVNIGKVDENSNEPNIRKNFVVTEKADGERHLMYISDIGKVYLINTNMDIIFTGSKTYNKECFNTLLDGELIVHDKNGKFINLYAAFDVYYVKKQDVRSYTFMLLETDENVFKSRYQILKFIQNNIGLVSIVDTQNRDAKSMKDIVGQFKKMDDFISPIRFVSKEFYPMSSSQTIFEGCNIILEKERHGRFEYVTDGLIFTHAFYGVGANEIGKSGPKNKITWDQSFKWKPPHYNTIDFLVTTLKGPNGDDVTKPLFEDGLNTDLAVQFSEYKTIELRCGFSEKRDGYINPCQDVIDDNIPGFSQRFEDRYENDYVPKRFYPTEPYDINAGIANIMLKMDDAGGKQMFSEDNEVFSDNTIVEFRYDFTKKDGWRWVPLRVRYDKTSKLRRGEKEYGNAYKVCNENWKSIHPSGRITEEMLSTGLGIPDITVSEDIYYNSKSGKYKTEAMKNFHNLYVKKMLIKGVSKPGDKLMDFACGKAGDLPKWIGSKLSFVFGVDISKDNLENRLDGACARYLNMKKTNKNVPYALFVNGNSSLNIKNGTGMLNDKAKQITAAVFGSGPKEVDKIGRGVARQYGKGDGGFNITSCQFAIHYFFENPDTLRGFMKNVAECTKLNGYFIGTSYDGKTLFKELSRFKTGESLEITDSDKKLCVITKNYGSDTFDDDSSSIGYKVDVYQESINQTLSEYLVNFDYLDRVMDAYGFKVVSREEANDFGLPEGSGLFSELFMNMIDEINKNKFKAKDYEQAPYMSVPEKKISFLNRYFVYKKIREVNTEKVELEVGEYEEAVQYRDAQDTKQAIDVALDVKKKSKQKITKLNKRLMLVAATEALDEPSEEAKPEKTVKTEKSEKPEKAIKGKTPSKNKKDKDAPKKLLIVDSDDE